jgi:hypothetical protein
MAADPRWRLSGGAGNADPDASLGGVMSATEVGAGPGNLFDDATGDETAAGDTEYRGVYVYNAGDVDLQNAVAWIVDEAGAGADIELAVADEAVGATMETIANENTAPAGPAFQEAPNKAGGIALGTIPAASRRGVWIKRAIAPGTPADNAAGFTLRVEGDSAA